jgi:predicted MPP superfamily phosphohydrolase
MKPKKMTRRSFLKKGLYFSLFTLLTSTGGYSYARYFEPRYVKIVHQTLDSPKIPNGFHGKRIVQFSDTHLGHNYSLEQLEKLVEKMNELNPDIIFFTGDLIDAPNEYNRVEEIVPVLKKLDAPDGKYAIYGNHDHGGYGSDIYKNVMTRSEFRLLKNEHHHIEAENDERIAVAGVDDILLGHPDMTKTFEHIYEDEFVIFMAHEPDIAAKLEEFPIDIQLSGHSHGGQVKIPFLGPLYTPPGAEIYYEGFYELFPRKMQLYVNRGIGTTRMPFRFLSAPELTVFTLEKTPSEDESG